MRDVLAAARRGRRSRVLMTADAVGGVWTYAIELARGLGEHGVDVWLAVMGAPLRPSQAAQAAGMDNLHILQQAYRLEWMDDPWDDVERAGEWLLSLERVVKPDLVHVNGYAHAALAFRAPALLAAHSCVLSWFRAVKGEDAPRSFDRYRREAARGVHAARMVVAPTQSMLTAVGAHYGAPRRARVIPNGIDGRRFRPGAKEPLVFASGRLWDEAKNMAVLDALAPALPCPVVVAGDADSPDGRRCEDLRLTALGWLAQEEMAAWLARASILVHPARYEPFGLSVLEAALSGCALVLGDIPSLREVWADAALYAPPGDAAAIETAILHLLNDDAARELYAARAIERAAAFGASAMVARYVDAYRELAPGAFPLAQKDVGPCA
jgi:glycogen synthase